MAQSRLSREELDRVLRRSAPSSSAAASVVWSRPALADLYVVAKMGGRQEVGVRLVAGGGSFEGRREADGGGVALLRPMAEATLDAVGELMQQGGRQVFLVLKDVRRFKRRGDDGVVVLPVTHPRGWIRQRHHLRQSHRVRQSHRIRQRRQIRQSRRVRQSRRILHRDRPRRTM